MNVIKRDLNVLYYDLVIAINSIGIYKSQRTKENDDRINELIKKETYNINLIIEEICEFNVHDKVMNVAYSYLVSEINRINNINNRNDYRLHIVLSKLNKWLLHVKKYSFIKESVNSH